MAKVGQFRVAIDTRQPARRARHPGARAGARESGVSPAGCGGAMKARAVTSIRHLRPNVTREIVSLMAK
jgi:hypothetical protein